MTNYKTSLKKTKFRQIVMRQKRNLAKKLGVSVLHKKKGHGST